jgi:hypothetical protein
VGLELAEIIRRYGGAYLKQREDQIPSRHRQVMRAIERCRTEALGGHIYQCQRCEETRYRYHSCRNRHCPKCQHEKAQQWLAAQQALLLPVPYYLLTFTLPAALRDVALRHQALLYHLLFRTSSAAAQSLAQDPRFVGGQIGLIGALHTWGRNLSYHPHVHYLVPAGGLSADGVTWLPARENFLLPVKALSRIFRARFRQALQKTPHFDQIPAAVWRQAWVVHCEAVGSGLPALKYLAPYIFRVAISNNRILKLADGQVTFCYQASDTGKTTVTTLSALEFIRRFLCHVLPKGFVKIRYYGFFAAGCRQKLAAIRRQLGDPPVEQLLASCEQIAQPRHTIPCPSCGQAMIRYQIILPRDREPP